MNKVPESRKLRFRYTIPSGRRAFSLAELVVSIGILVFMLLLAGQVYNFTIRSTGQATALTQVNQRLRTFEQILREDLRNVQPDRSMILIQGNPVANVVESGDHGCVSHAFSGRVDDLAPYLGSGVFRVQDTTCDFETHLDTFPRLDGAGQLCRRLRY